MKPINRKSAIHTLAFGIFAFPRFIKSCLIPDKYIDTRKAYLPNQWKGNIQHSVCYEAYKEINLEEFCSLLKFNGIYNIDLIKERNWERIKNQGMNLTMGYIEEISFKDGFNQLRNHEKLISLYTKNIPILASFGFNNLLCFSGNREGLSDEQGLENAAQALKKIMPLAEKHKVTLSMELLNSKINHPDYHSDHTAWGVELCQRVASPNFKLLFDIYHMQIMEGNLINTIEKYHPYISHFHVAGVPGRHEIDEKQEINYSAVMEAIVKTGYNGTVSQEFIPSTQNKLTSLFKSFNICDV